MIFLINITDLGWEKCPAGHLIYCWLCNSLYKSCVAFAKETVLKIEEEETNQEVCNVAEKIYRKNTHSKFSLPFSKRDLNILS